MTEAFLHRTLHFACSGSSFHSPLSYDSSDNLTLITSPHIIKSKDRNGHESGRTKTNGRLSMACSTASDVLHSLPAAPVLLPDGPWVYVPGGVTAAKGFKAAGVFAGLRAKGEKPDLALITCGVDAVSAGAFTTNVMAAAPVIYCKNVLEISKKARAVLINSGQANAATGDAGYEDVVECVSVISKSLGIQPDEVLVGSTGVIGHRINKEALIRSLPLLVGSLSSTVDGADAAATAITTTDLVKKSVAIESEVGGTRTRIGGMAKGSGMIHPNMATMLGVITTDALVTPDAWRHMVKVAVGRSFNQITVDGDTSTNDTVIALASGLSGSTLISSWDSHEGKQLQSCLDAVMQCLAKSIAWDGEGATCLIEVTVGGAESDVVAARVARTVASSSLVKAAVYGRDPNWGRFACAAGYSGVPFESSRLRISLGDFFLMDEGEPLPFDREGARQYMREAGENHATVEVGISIGEGKGRGRAWGCDLSYDYVKINAEYST